jgi:hypothetical protein
MRLLAYRFKAPTWDVAVREFESKHPRSVNLRLVRAAVPGATPDNWGEPLITGETVLYGAFLATASQASVLGRLAYMPADFYRKVPTQTKRGAAKWVGAGRPMTVTAGGVGTVSLHPHKVAGVAVTTNEVFEATSDKAMGVLADLLRGAVVEAEDEAFLDPSNSGDGDKPAAITYGVTPIRSNGFTAEAVRADIEALIGVLRQAGVPLKSLAFITSTENAIALGNLAYASGAPVFPGLGLDGGTILGAPLIASDYAGPQLVAVAQEFVVAAEGSFEVGLHNKGSLEMSDAPIGDAGVPTGATNVVSLMQTNSTAISTLREADWAMRMPGAVAYISDFVPPAPPAGRPAEEAA